MAPKAKASPAKKPAKGGVEKKAAKPKKEKKEGPKRPLSAYFIYVNENREQIKTDNPDVTFGQIGKIAGEQWKALTDKEKKPYQDKAAKDKERYEKEKAEFEASKE